MAQRARRRTGPGAMLMSGPHTTYIQLLKDSIEFEIHEAQALESRSLDPSFHWGKRDGLREALRLLGVRDIP